MDAGSLTPLLENSLTSYGYLALFLLFVLEGAMLLYIAPSESLVPASILILADSTVDIGVILFVAVLGATLGQTALFLLAKRKGREYLLNQSWFRVSDDRLSRFEGWFNKWGILAIPLSNTFLFTRGMLTVPAGLANMDTRLFIVLSALGTLVFESLLAALTLGVLPYVS